MVRPIMIIYHKQLCPSGTKVNMIVNGVNTRYKMAATTMATMVCTKHGYQSSNAGKGVEVGGTLLKDL